MKHYNFACRSIDGIRYVVYALDEKALHFLAEWLGVKLWSFEHHEVEKNFLGAASQAGFRIAL